MQAVNEKLERLITLLATPVATPVVEKKAKVKPATKVAKTSKKKVARRK